MRSLALPVAFALTSIAEDGVLARVSALAGHFGAVSRQIWESPELGSTNGGVPRSCAKALPECPRRLSRHGAAGTPREAAAVRTAGERRDAGERAQAEPNGMLRDVYC